MEIYFILLLWSVVSGFICFYKKNISLNDKNMKFIYCIMNIIPISMVSGLRSPSVGTDTLMYHEIFYQVGKADFQWSFMDDRNIEIGYRLWNKIIYIFFEDANIFILITSSLLIIGFFLFFYRYSVNIWLTTFLFIGLMYYCETLNTLRQSIALMILLNSYHFLESNKILKWIIGVMLATSFHNTAVIFIIFIVLGKISKLRVGLISFFVCVFYLMLVYGRDLLLEVFVDSKYAYYLVSNDNSMGADILRIILFIGVILFIYFRKKVYDKKEKKNIVIWSVFLLYGIIMTFSKYQIEIFYRMVQYFSIYIIILLPISLYKFNMKKYYLYIIILVVVPILLYYLLSKNINLNYSVFF